MGKRRRWLLWTVAVALVVLLTPLAYLAYVIADADRRMPEVLARLRAESQPVTLEELGPERVRMLLAVEDPGFYGHNGVDVGTPGAGLTTITQGLVKRYFFEEFRPGWAKVSQTIIATRLDASLPKQEQLAAFVNTVYLGEGDSGAINGFSAGAREYFGKDVRELSDDQYLSLVAMIVSPNQLDPRRAPGRNSERVARIRALLAGRCAPASVRDVYYERCAGR